MSKVRTDTCTTLARERPVEDFGVVPDRDAKNPPCRARSRAAIEFCFGGLRESRWILAVFCLDLIDQRAQGRARAGIANHSFPRRVAIQLRQQCRQAPRQFFPLFRRKFLDGYCDFLNAAHTVKLAPRPCFGKTRAKSGRIDAGLLARRSGGDGASGRRSSRRVC